ncbi:MAG: uroporphyrinogen-III C-methyltransferase [Gammaproteobacteria bacterium]
MNPDTPANQTSDAGFESSQQSSPAPGSEAVAEAEPIKPVYSTPSSGRWAVVFALFALLTALSLSAAGYYGWRQLTQSRDVLTQQVGQSEARLASVQTDVQSMRTSISRELDERLKAVQGAQQEMLESMRALNAQVRQKTGVSTVLAEAEYLMRSANNHLLFDRDVDTAIAALTAADDRLRATGDPDTLKVRGLLADEINALGRLQKTDLPGLVLTLNSLIDSVDQLPLKLQASTPPKAQGQTKTDDWRSLFGNIWASLKSLVVVRYDNKTAAPLIAPEQSYFLYQNLRLQLEAARLALLRRDAPSYRATLNTARNWLTIYFDTNTAATRHLLNTLARLSDTEINPPLPEISSSLKALVDLIEVRATSAPVVSVDTSANTALAPELVTPAPETAGVADSIAPPATADEALQP